VTKDDKHALAALGVVAVAAVALLMKRDASADGSTWQPPLYGTGTKLREPVPIPVVEPTLMEEAASTLTNWYRAIVGDDTSPLAAGQTGQVKSPTQWRAELQPLFRAQEASYAMPRGLLEAVADKESSFRDDIIRCRVKGGVGEEGIMQLRPEFHLANSAARCDPYVAIPYAAKYLAKLYLQFGTWEEAIAAYNWGPGNVARSGLQAAPASTKSYIAFVKDRDYVEGFV
jgi:soluble lytic murein transglycosylase-like protein